MIWLAGFALAFLVIALCFVSMGFLRTDLKQAGAATPPSPSFSASVPSAPATAGNDGITVISRSVHEFLSGSADEPQVENAAATPPAIEISVDSDDVTAPDTANVEAALTLPVVPRRKPTLATTVAAVADYVPTPINMNSNWIADNIRLGFAHERDFTGGATPIFTASTREAPLPYDPAPDNIILIRSGESLSEALDRLNVRAIDRDAAIAAIAEQVNVRTIKPGTEITVSLMKPEMTVYEEVALIGQPDRMPGQALKSLDLVLDNLRRLQLRRDAAAQFSARIHVANMTKRYATVSGTITDSLFASAAREGMPHEIASKLSNMFLYDIDFQREIRYGDEFEAVYEVFYDDKGRAVDYGDVLFGRMSWMGGAKERGYYRFVDDGDLAWFDAEGSSARRLLMKTPIEGARITSSFGMRKHPVLGYTKGHKGTDFGAGRGTPIMAAGDGVIERANVFSSYGNYVKIKHAAGYETAYAHLNGFATGIKAGVRVRQGDVIGYVGSTGRSTGPHLHYEVIYNGEQVNPMTVKVADGRKLSGDDMDAFAGSRDWINAMRAKARPQTLALKQG